MTEKLIRITAPHFVAGLVIRDAYATEAAPILRWAIGKHEDWLREWFKRKGWRASVVPE